jgi:hypothetical protein
VDLQYCYSGVPRDSQTSGAPDGVAVVLQWCIAVVLQWSGVTVVLQKLQWYYFVVLLTAGERVLSLTP